MSYLFQREHRVREVIVASAGIRNGSTRYLLSEFQDIDTD